MKRQVLHVFFVRSVWAVEVPGPKIDVGKLAMAIAPLAAHIDISCLAPQFFAKKTHPMMTGVTMVGDVWNFQPEHLI